MSKRPPKPGSTPPLTPSPFAPGGGMRPTVPLPGVAGGGFRATVPMPGLAAAPRPPSAAEITEAMRIAAAHFGARHLRQAEMIAEKVLSAVPTQPDALHLLGLIAFETGAYDKAERLIGSAVKASRKPSANMLVNYGNPLREQGKFDEARNAYDRALKLDPAYADAYLERGIMKKYNYEYQSALDDFAKAIELRPDYALAYARSSEVKMDMGLFREALVFCNQALERIPQPPVSIFSLMANLHDRLSELDKAREYAEKALALDPLNPEGTRIWAKAERRKHAGGSPALVEARRRLASLDKASMTIEQRRINDAELAQICEKQGDIDAAFGYFEAMNSAAAVEADIRHIDKQIYVDEVATVSAGITREAVAKWQELPPVAPTTGHRAAHVFLVGFPRSGTTLLDQIMDAHPDVQVFEELPTLIKARNRLKRLQNEYPASLADISEQERAEFRKIYFEEYESVGAKFGEKIVVNKMPLNLAHGGLIQRVFPDAKIIFALRHPADVVLSCFMQDFQLNFSMASCLTLQDTAKLYDQVMTLWQRYRELLPLNVVEVRYENLVRDLRSEVEPVLDFLGLPWNEAQADPAAHALARGTIRTPSYAQVTQPIYASATDRWRRYEKHLAPVLPLLEKHIRQFGYAL
ncbi:MAG TPA: sulfotransferase [Parvibaculum sp.]